jgi:hypothetical protein
MPHASPAFSIRTDTDILVTSRKDFYRQALGAFFMKPEQRVRLLLEAVGRLVASQWSPNGKECSSNKRRSPMPHFRIVPFA